MADIFESLGILSQESYEEFLKYTVEEINNTSFLNTLKSETQKVKVSPEAAA